MHIAEGFLPPVHAAAWSAVAAPFVIHGAREIKRTIEKHPESKLLLGGVGAYSFVLSAIKLPSVTGSSSHPTGTGEGAIIFRPPVMAALGTIVLLFQALLLAHGGLTTLGANVMSMAVVGPWAGYGVYRLMRRAPLSIAVFCAVAVSDLMTYVTTATQLALAFPDRATGFVGAWSRFLGLFAVTRSLFGLFGYLTFRGILAALTRGGIVDKILVGSALLFYSLPTFAIGLLLYQFVALKWGIVPVPEYQSIADGGVGGWLQGLILPALTLALFTAAGYVRMTRAYVLETMSEDYLRTAKAKGLSKGKTLWKHTMRAAITPIMTMAGIDFALLVGGAPITETVFDYDGLGKLAVASASASPDLPTTVGIVVVLSALVIVANIIVDCLYAVVDPRVKLA